MALPRRTLATSVAVLVAAVVASVSYRVRHPPMRVEGRSAVAFPRDAGEYRVLTFTRGRGEWTASVARLRAGHYGLSLVTAPEGAGVGAGTWVQSAGTDAGALVAVNGGYFDGGGRAIGLRVAGGKETSPLVTGRATLSGVVYVVAGGDARIVAAGAALPGGVETAVQAGPLLVEPGGRMGIRSEEGPAARRTVIATTAGGDLLVVVTSPVTLAEVAEALVGSPGSFGVDRVECAMNLDGGPSAAMLVRTPAAHFWMPPAGAVRDALIVVPR